MAVPFVWVDPRLDLAALQLRLIEVDAAWHNVMINGFTTSLSYDGKSVSYNRANAGDLERYRWWLLFMIDKLMGKTRGPISLSF